MTSAVFSFLLFHAFGLMLVSCNVNTTWMRNVLSEHFSKPRHHVTNPDYKHQTMEFIRDQFREMRLETHIHTFSTSLANVTGINVIGLLKGQRFNTPSDFIVGIGAHYDTVRYAPGVDDNGAAVVVLLQAVRELTRHADRKYTLLFLAFDFEEWEAAVTNKPTDTVITDDARSTRPAIFCIQLERLRTLNETTNKANYTDIACPGVFLCGSRSLVNEWLPNFWTQPVGWGGIFVMDTIMNFNRQNASQDFPVGVDQIFPEQAESIMSDGVRGDFLMVAGRPSDQSLLANFSSHWGKLGQPRFELETFIIPQEPPLVFQDFLRSDHAAFWSSGWNAVFLSDTANYRGYMKNCYHRECDDFQSVTVDMLDFVAKTCQTLIAVLDDLSPAIDSPPSSSGVLVQASRMLMTAVLLLTGPTLSRV